jgi:hypothetical protein
MLRLIGTTESVTFGEGEEGLIFQIDMMCAVGDRKLPIEFQRLVVKRDTIWLVSGRSSIGLVQGVMALVSVTDAGKFRCAVTVASGGNSHHRSHFDMPNHIIWAITDAMRRDLSEAVKD